MSNNIIEINNLTKKYKNKLILDSLNLTITKNVIAGLVGLNGIGKTTLIKIILNLINQYEGECKINNISSKNENARKNIFFMPEKFTPMEQLTGLDFIKLNYQFYYPDITLPRDKILDYAEQIHFDAKKLEDNIKKYSKGMIQKIGLLSMFVIDKPIWILDEPMSGLDPIVRYQLKQLFIKHQQNGGTILFTSHLLNDVEEIASQIIILDKGQIKFNGTLDNLLTMLQVQNIEQAYLELVKYA